MPSLNLSLTTSECYVSKEKGVVCSKDADLSFIQPCIHEEADTRMILHAYDAASKGTENILIQRIVSDVVLATANYVANGNKGAVGGI